MRLGCLKKTLTFDYFSHNYQFGEAGAVGRTDIFHLDITDLITLPKKLDFGLACSFSGCFYVTTK